MDIQRRIPSPIADVVSSVSYNGRLKTSPEKLAQVQDCCMWLDVKGKEIRHQTSKFNMEEVEAISTCLECLAEQPMDTVVLTFYASQASKLRDALKIYPNVQVATVDSFQGREYDRVFLSLVGTETTGFLADKRRMNVALTRVKEQLWIVGNHDFWAKAEDVPALVQLGKIACKESF